MLAHLLFCRGPPAKRSHLSNLTRLSILTNVADPPSYGGTNEPWTMNYEPWTMNHLQESRISERSADPAPIELSSRLIGAGQGISTTVENPLQISYFLCKTNPISKMPKMNVNLYVIEDYENEPPSGPKKTNPKQTQFLQRPTSLAKKSGHSPRLS